MPQVHMLAMVGLSSCMRKSLVQVRAEWRWRHQPGGWAFKYRRGLGAPFEVGMQAEPGTCAAYLAVGCLIDSAGQVCVFGMPMLAAPECWCPQGGIRRYHGRLTMSVASAQKTFSILMESSATV
eukprot:14211326-Alexandrium_andersonii.AAC.1